MYDESFIHLEKKVLIDFSQQRFPRWYILHALIYYASKMISVPWAPWQDGKLGGSLSRENLEITTKDFAKSRGEGVCTVLISFSHQTHFTFHLYFRCRSIIQTSSRGEDKHVRIELETKALIGGRKTEMYLCCCSLPRFCFAFPTWRRLKKRWGKRQ